MRRFMLLVTFALLGLRAVIGGAKARSGQDLARSLKRAPTGILGKVQVIHGVELSVSTSGLVSCPDGQPEPEDRSAASTSSVADLAALRLHGSGRRGKT